MVTHLTFEPFNSLTVVTDNIWGWDLDGTMQGAGGVGGLLAVLRDDGTYLPTYDANGNISEYIDANDGSIAAHYDYSPFGEILIQQGDLANTFWQRFSTKPYCPITKLVEYQLRKYRPEVGRWMSRDPIEEKGGMNLYLFIGNMQINIYDYLGKFMWPPLVYNEPVEVILKPGETTPMGNPSGTVAGIKFLCECNHNILLCSIVFNPIMYYHLEDIGDNTGRRHEIKHIIVYKNVWGPTLFELYKEYSILDVYCDCEDQKDKLLKAFNALNEELGAWDYRQEYWTYNKKTKSHYKIPSIDYGSHYQVLRDLVDKFKP